MVSEALMSHHMSDCGCCRRAPRIWELVGLVLMSAPRAAAPGTNECNQKHSKTGIERTEGFQWEKCLFVPAEILCSSFQILTTAWESAGGVWGGTRPLHLSSDPKELLMYLCITARRNWLQFCIIFYFFPRGAVIWVAPCSGDHVWIPRGAERQILE